MYWTAFVGNGEGLWEVNCINLAYSFIIIIIIFPGGC